MDSSRVIWTDFTIGTSRATTSSSRDSRTSSSFNQRKRLAPFGCFGLILRLALAVLVVHAGGCLPLGEGRQLPEPAEALLR